MVRVTSLCFALLAATAASAQPQPVALAPAGPWKADFADDRCILTRPYAGGTASHHLALLFFPATQRVVTRLTNLEKVRESHYDKALVSIDGKPVRRDFNLSLRSGEKGVAVRELHFEDFRTNLANTKRNVHIDAGKRGVIDVELGDFSKPLNVVQTCLDDLHKRLGIDPVEARAVVTQPYRDIFSFITLPDGGEMYTTLLYWVTPEGSVDQCRVIKTTTSAKAGERMCADLMKKAKFEPARNAAGQPVRGPNYDSIGRTIRSESSVTRY